MSIAFKKTLLDRLPPRRISELAAQFMVEQGTTPPPIDLLAVSVPTPALLDALSDDELYRESLYHSHSSHEPYSGKPENIQRVQYVDFLQSVSRRKSFITIPVNLPEDERMLLAHQNNPAHMLLERIDDLVSCRLRVSTEKLFTYAVFSEWHHLPAWRSYQRMAAKMPDRRKQFDDYINVDDERLSAKNSPTTGMRESIGVGASLSFAERVLGISEADFESIDITPKEKTLDFSHEVHCTDGHSIFQIECKGTVDGKTKSRQIQSIKEKKKDQKRRFFGRNKRILIGTILELQSERETPTQLSVYDPPEVSDDRDPGHYLLILRLKYYLLHLQRISYRSRITAALANRIRVLEELRDNTWRQLDGVPLVTASGSPIQVPEEFAHAWPPRRRRRSGSSAELHGRIYDLRCTDIRVHGMRLEMLQQLPQRLYYWGLRRRVIEAIVEQRFSSIVSQHGEEGNSADNIEYFSSGVAAGFIRDETWDTDDEGLPKVYKFLR